jgi:hypothetical protein
MSHAYRENGDPWRYIQEWDVEAAGPSLLDSGERARWAGAFRRAGGLPYIWRELAPQVSEIVYSLLELRVGDRILIVGEAIQPCGWESAIAKLVGTNGSVDSFEIIHRARESIGRGEMGRNGAVGSWKWDYTEDIADNAYDGVVLMQSAQHCDDWSETSRELLRVIKPGRRIVSAEALMVGPQFLDHINADVHIQEWYDKMASVVPVSAGAISFYTADDLLHAFTELVEGAGALEWRGIELFWGRKPNTTP